MALVNRPVIFLQTLAAKAEPEAEQEAKHEPKTQTSAEINV